MDGWREAPVMRTAHRSRRSVTATSAFAGFRFLPDVVVVAVRWYLRFCLSYRDLEELLTERGRGRPRHRLPVGAAVHAPALLH